jgi:broad specificity phosphatase PhoE
MENKNKTCYNKNLNEENVFYIRHGQTNYNKDAHHLEHVNIKELSKEEILEKLPIKWDNKYLDGALNEVGREQSENLGKNLNDFEISYVFCSPLRRCIETCLISLKNHKNLEKLKIIIHPLVTEFIHTIHDGSMNLKEKIDYFSQNYKGYNIDWSLLENKDETYNYEFIDFNYKDCEENKNNSNQIISFSDIVKYSFLNYKRPESFKGVFKRILCFKKYLEENILNKANGKILVFTHSGYLRLSSLSKNFEIVDELEYPKEIYNPNNCEILGINVTI